MSKLANVMSLFTGQTPAAPAANTQGQPNPQGQPAGQKPGDNLQGGKNASAGEQQNSQQLEQGGKQGEQGASPLDEFKDIWQPNETKPEGGEQGKPAGDGKPAKPQGLNYGEIAKRIDFARLIPQELLTKATSGDAAAFAQVINSVSQATFAASMKMANDFAARSGKDLETRITGSLPEHFKKFSLSDSTPKNPTLSHPAVRPMVEAIKAQLAMKFPEATTADLNQKAEQYVGAMFTEIGKGNPQEKSEQQADPRKAMMQAQENGEFDWGSYFGN
jgi:hypothetical protein